MNKLNLLEKKESEILGYKKLASKGFDKKLAKIEKIKEKIYFKSFDKDAQLQEAIKKLQETISKDISIISNDINGVDYCLSYKLDNYNIEYLERYLQDENIYLNRKDEYLSYSTADEAFLNYENGYLYYNNDSYKTKSYLEAVLLFKKLCIEAGYYPSLFKVYRYGDCQAIEINKYISQDIINLQDSQKIKILEILIGIERQEYDSIEIENFINNIVNINDISNIEVNSISIKDNCIKLETIINYNFTCDLYDANNEIIQENKEYIGSIQIKDLI